MIGRSAHGCCFLFTGVESCFGLILVTLSRPKGMTVVPIPTKLCWLWLYKLGLRVEYCCDLGDSIDVTAVDRCAIGVITETCLSRAQNRTFSCDSTASLQFRAKSRKLKYLRPYLMAVLRSPSDFVACGLCGHQGCGKGDSHSHSKLITEIFKFKKSGVPENREGTQN